MLRSYLTHNPSNIACMQIVSSNSNRRSRASIFRQQNLPLYSKGCNLPFQSSIQWKNMRLIMICHLVTYICHQMPYMP
jgi:hypothetical protein